jgi:hypothetical protein
LDYVKKGVTHIDKRKRQKEGGEERTGACPKKWSHKNMAQFLLTNVPDLCWDPSSLLSIEY